MVPFPVPFLNTPLTLFSEILEPTESSIYDLHCLAEEYLVICNVGDWRIEYEAVELFQELA